MMEGEKKKGKDITLYRISYVYMYKIYLCVCVICIDSYSLYLICEVKVGFEPWHIYMLLKKSPDTKTLVMKSKERNTEEKKDSKRNQIHSCSTITTNPSYL